MNYLSILDIVSLFVFVFAISYYSITLLQWYNYDIWRVITKHHKYSWHLIYFVCPVVMFFVCFWFDVRIVFYIYLYLVYIPMLIYWVAKLDKRVVFTKRVCRFFVILLVFMLINELIFFIFQVESLYYLCLLSFVFALVFGKIFEDILMRNFIALAKDKLALMPELKIIAITASFGKTSIKNFVAQIFEGYYNIHTTARSINTLKGIVADINNNLNFGTDMYIIEAGARQEGDISEIATLVNPQVAVIGEIGKAHIEYFKTIEKIVKTKFELLESHNLKKAFVYAKNPIPQDLSEAKKALIEPYPLKLRNINATLEQTSFEMEIDGKWELFETYILGRFNVENIAVAIMLAKYFGIKLSNIQKAVKKLTPIPHRFNLSLSNGKTIIDDGFNGNLNGMLEGIRLCGLFEGRKFIVTPGLIESDDESNIKLAEAINKVFDLAIITGDRNSNLLSSHLHIQKVISRDKSQLENVLKGMITSGSLVYFANDAPSYI
ncbi:UDP-N-acetylmuramoyl-tripeptide--D-alanyl-D-alanine ligase [uncultured Helicobacter sp.]|uniref:Mur ligase family protein n=1 Tax=uncultured Helicobacter sp. TaxID=175537 RepID=UPI00258DD78C|nr:UDP-N-acetylmuramoyl-tripeptide--D-alanyl-D-alanine ligase [uncultured Helicobacter sp.]